MGRDKSRGTMSGVGRASPKGCGVDAKFGSGALGAGSIGSVRFDIFLALETGGVGLLGDEPNDGVLLCDAFLGLGGGGLPSLDLCCCSLSRSSSSCRSAASRSELTWFLRLEPRCAGVGGGALGRSWTC